MGPVRRINGYVNPPIFVLCFFLELFKALAANLLVLEVDDVLGVSAENAARLILLQYDLISVYEHLERILGVDIHIASCLNGDDNSSEVIDMTNDSE